MPLCLVTWPGRNGYESKRSMAMVSDYNFNLFLTDQLPFKQAEIGETICKTMTPTSENIDYIIHFWAKKSQWEIVKIMFEQAFIFKQDGDKHLDWTMVLNQIKQVPDIHQSSAMKSALLQE
jgi:hypothetical protein